MIPYHSNIWYFNPTAIKSEVKNNASDFKFLVNSTRLEHYMSAAEQSINPNKYKTNVITKHETFGDPGSETMRVV